MRLILVLGLFLGCQSILFSQQKYWIFFTDKASGVNDFDSPVAANYTDSLKKLDFNIISSSKWLNAIVVEENENLIKLNEISFIEHIQEVGAAQEVAQTNEEPIVESLEFYLNQMSGWALVKKGLTGKGVKIGLIDAGFSKLKEQRELLHVFENKQLVVFRDFIEPERKNVEDEIQGSGSHGQKVFTKVAGYKKEEGELIGFATGASFYLARTENSEKEHKVEEYDWVRALEWMDSLGVQLVNSSLGYSQFDDANENYTKSQMNGKYGITSRAAEIAVQEKGMFLVISAGNAGAKDWRLVTVPADAPSVLTIGATQKKGGIKIGYSSIGPDYNDYLKPDVAVYSPNGTSFSSPAVAGYVACLMEYAPQLTNIELLEVVRKSASLYPYGNNYIGYGVPNAEKAMSMIDNGIRLSELTYEKKVKGTKAKLTFKTLPIRDVAIFRKKDKWSVGDQFLLKPYGDVDVLKKRNIRIKKKKSKFTILLKKKSWEKFTTIQNGKEVIEIIWE
jgi:subtilisin family serine protease